MMNADAVLMAALDIEKLRNVAKRATNPKFKALWNELADRRADDLAGAPWLRTYDGRLK